MNNTNIFEYASRNKFRYPYKGLISTEDLWDLSPAQLDTVYKNLNKEVEVNRVPSLTCVMDSLDFDLLTKIDIVKHVFKVKEQEVEARKNAAVKAAKRQRIMDILAQKQDSALQSLSEDDLRKMLAEME